jgi:hypothetical protein
MKQKYFPLVLWILAAGLFLGCPIFPIITTETDTDTKPTAPEYVNARRRADGIILRWSPGKNAGRYNIFWSVEIADTANMSYFETVNGYSDGSLQCFIPANEADSTIGALTQGKTYHFAIKSRNYDDVESGFSPIASIKWE